MKQPEKPVEGAPFNMCMMFYFTLHKNIQIKGQACIEDDLFLWYKIMRVIFRDISFKLNTEEKDKFKVLFIKAKNMLVNIEKSPLFMQSAYEMLDETDMYITEVMNKYKMIFPDIAIKGMEELEKRYNL